MVGVQGKLVDELTLGAAVTFAEGVDGIEFAEVEGGAWDEVSARSVEQKVLFLQHLQKFCEASSNVSGTAKICVAFGDVDESELPGPGEDVLKQILVNCTKMLLV